MKTAGFSIGSSLGPELPTQQLSRRGFLRLAGLGLGGLGSVQLTSARLWAESLASRSQPLDVLVLGAGMAGLVAAFELKRAGHRVTVLEATLRAGGRVRTLREPFGDGLYAEAGAGRIPVTHHLTREYAQRFGLTLTPYRPTGGATVIYGAGRRLLASPGQPFDLGKLGMPFSEAELRLGLEGMYRQYLGRFAKEVGTVPAEDWPSASVRHLGNVTIGQLLHREGASPAAIRYLTTGYEFDSALDFLRDAYSHEAPQLDHIVGGNDLLPQAFARELSPDIIYGADVVRIEQTQHKVAVVCARAGSHERLMADRIICALPFSTLRRVEFSPRLSAAKERAIQQLPYGSVTRVYLQYRRRFWLDEGCNGFADCLDLPLEIWNPTHDQPGERGIHLGYMYESLARRVASLPEPERERRFLEIIQGAFPGASRWLEGGTSFAWAEQPYQQGAYAVYTKGMYAKLGPDVARPEGNIHFAGEHASPWPGWIQGALFSGLRAAKAAVDGWH